MMIDNIHWLGHASLRIDAPGAVVYVDPWKLSGDPPPADLILITHEHYDHCSLEDIARVRTDDTVIVANPGAAKKISGPVRVVRAGDELSAKGVKIQAVPAYNVDKDFHPKAAGHVGFLLTIDDTSIYVAGDTDVIPEMQDIDADIAILPVSGTYVMTADQAVEAAGIIAPGIAIPVHYGEIVGSAADAQQFLNRAACEVRILQKEQ